MSEGWERIHWAPKVQPGKIRHLYETDALGIVDDELVDDVGSALLERCRAVLMVSAGRVACPRCGTEFALTPGTSPWVPHTAAQESAPVTCPTPNCGWQTTWVEWHASWRHRELLGTKALPAIEEYSERYPKALSPRARMLLIDALIHAFHWDLIAQLPNRSAANNLIEGNHEQVVAFLDALTYGPGSTEGLDARRDEWRATVAAMMRRRRPPRGEPDPGH
ncbi:MAG: hypothetical protein ACYC5O_17935 [Anaerolineae bacterium]